MNTKEPLSLQEFAIMLSKINIDNIHTYRKEEKIAKEEGIVIAFGDSDITFLRGAINHEIEITDDGEYETEEDFDNRYRGKDIYFDKIGFFWPFKRFKTTEDWEMFLSRKNKQYFKMKSYFHDCNFPFVPFNSLDNDGTFGITGIVFKCPKYDGIYLPEFRILSYEDSETESQRLRTEFFSRYSDENYFDNWTCDACGGNQDTGCLSSSECFRD